MYLRLLTSRKFTLQGEVFLHQAGSCSSIPLSAEEVVGPSSSTEKQCAKPQKEGESGRVTEVNSTYSDSSNEPPAFHT